MPDVLTDAVCSMLIRDKALSANTATSHAGSPCHEVYRQGTAASPEKVAATSETAP